MTYTLDHALHEVVNAPEGYVAVSGVLTFDPSDLPKTDWDHQDQTPPLTRVSAQMKGKSLTKSGFTGAFDRRISMEVACFGPWCAGATSDKPMLAFLKQTSRGYSLSLTPCGGHAFADPSPKDLRKVHNCYLKGTCPKPAH